ncbi:MAG: monofunctional biosynthetic peptidoglycan transglycosylase [Nevskia sp.]|nr:monofunctional biosynthetic peptidoglycan transglycosylase [Nevskia sp.]
MPRIEPSLGPPVDGAARPVPRERVAPPVPPPRRRRWPLLLPGLALLPVLILAVLRWVPPPVTAYMLQSPVRPVHYRWVPARDIAESARQAVVASEDQKFWVHHGFDLEAIRQAQEYNRNPRHHRRGASTISQQTAKNLFLWPGGGYFRKGLEALLTVLIERLWGKQRILEVYLNVAEFGPGVYGVEAAAEAYFDKPAARLSQAEAARLAAVLPNPRHWSVRNPGAYAQARAAWILGQIAHGAGSPAAEEPDLPADESTDDDAGR